MEKDYLYTKAILRKEKDFWELIFSYKDGSPSFIFKINELTIERKGNGRNRNKNKVC